MSDEPTTDDRTGQQETTFGACAESLYRSGYRPIPILPNSKRPALPNWPRALDLEHVRKLAGNGQANCGIGVLTGEAVPGTDTSLHAVDMDVPDEEAIALLDQVLRRSLTGPAPCRIGKAPKVAFLVRMPGSGSRIRNSTKYLDPKDPTKTYQIQLLGQGQQLVLYGTHPETGKAYVWQDPGQTPLVLEAKDLPVLDEAGWDGLRMEFDRIAKARSWGGAGQGTVNAEPAESPGPSPADEPPEAPDTTNVEALTDQELAQALAGPKIMDDIEDMDCPLPKGSRSERYLGLTSRMALHGVRPERLLATLLDRSGPRDYLDSKAEPRSWAWKYLVWPAVKDRLGMYRDASQDFTAVADANRGQVTPGRDIAELFADSHRPISDLEWARADQMPPDIIEGLMPASAGGLVGAGQSGKTTLLIWEAIHIVLGRDLYDHKVALPGPVLFISAEDERPILLHRIKRLCEGLGLSEVETRRVRDGIRVLDLSHRTARLCQQATKGGIVTRTELASEIFRQYRESGFRLVCVDPVSLLGPGEQAANDGMAEMMRIARHGAEQLSQPSRSGLPVSYCAWQMVHHVAKAVDRESIRDQYAGRGGGAFADNGRFVRQLDRLREREFEVSSRAWLAPPEESQTDLLTDRVTILLHHKHSYRARFQTPIVLVRDGFSYQWHLALALDDPLIAQSLEDEKDASQRSWWRGVLMSAGQVAGQSRAGSLNRITLRQLRDDWGRIGKGSPLGRNAALEVLQGMLADGDVLEEDLPEDEKWGRRTTSLVLAQAQTFTEC